MKSFSKTKTWNRWSGSPKDLATASDVAQKAIKKWSSSKKIESDVEIEIGDLTSNAETIDAITSIDERDLSVVSRLSIRIYISERGFFSIPRASIRVDNTAPALAAEVHGGDRIGVEGLIAELTEILDRGKRRPYWLRHNMINLLAAPLPGLFVLLAVSLAHWLGIAHSDGKWQLAEIVSIGVGIVVGGGAYYGLSWLTPDLELIPHNNGKTRLRRWRSWLWTSLIALSLALVAAWLYEAITM
jgi:hypothetical protein